MFITWAKNQPDQAAKTGFERQVVGAKPVLDRLKNILQDNLRDLEESEINIKSFNTPNWAMQQSYKFGYKAALKEIMKLVDLDKQEPPKETE